MDMQSKAGQGKGEGGTNWEIGIDMYTPLCVKQAASGPAINHRELSQGSVMT